MNKVWNKGMSLGVKGQKGIANKLNTIINVDCRRSTSMQLSFFRSTSTVDGRRPSLLMFSSRPLFRHAFKVARLIR